MHEAAAVCEALRIALTKVAGSEGFAALLRRALALAGAQVPTLQSVKIKPDGHLEGLDEVDADAAVALTAHLLGLLVTFIGEPLTLRLLREAWPDAALEPGDTRQ